MSDTLPIEPYLATIAEGVRDNSVTLLRASPGSGKTTRVPSYLLNQTVGKVWVLQPRRIAALSTAQYICESQGFSLGEQVGYHVRFDACYDPQKTKLLFMTEALALKKMLDSKVLLDVGIIILDEFHERSVTVDLVLAYLLAMQKTGAYRGRILIMSATLELEALQKYVPELKVFDVPGKLYPLNVHYDIKPQSLKCDRAWQQRVIEKVVALHQSYPQESLLVFLPGKNEIEQLYKALLPRLGSTRKLFKLHGQLEPQEQKMVLQSHPLPKCILSTNVAESSVTISGVSLVLDSGLERTTTWHRDYWTQELSLKRICLASHRQRAGRAAREKPGQAFLMWTKADELSMSNDLMPEILSVDLREWVLWKILFSERAQQDLQWLTSPDPKTWQAALEYLLKQKLVLNNDSGAYTLSDLGKKTLSFPLGFEGSYYLARYAQLSSTQALLPVLVYLFEGSGGREGGDPDWENDVLMGLASQWDQFRRHPVLLGLAREWSLSPPRSTWSDFLDIYESHGDEFIQNYLRCFPYRLVQRRQGKGQQRKGLLATGRGVVQSARSQVQRAPYYIATQMLFLDNEIQVSQAIPFAWEKFAEQSDLPFELVREEKPGQWGQILRWDQIVLREKWQPISDGVLPSQALLIPGQERLFFQTERLQAVQSWLGRWLWFCKQKNTESFWPDLVGLVIEEWDLKDPKKCLAFTAEQWIQAFESVLGYQAICEWQQLCPSFWLSGQERKVQIIYGDDSLPKSEILLRDLFGTHHHPVVMLNVPIQLVVLGPHQRPIQITQNLDWFWSHSYFELRKEMRGRYPKQPWPDQPRDFKTSHRPGR